MYEDKRLIAYYKWQAEQQKEMERLKAIVDKLKLKMGGYVCPKCYVVIVTHEELL